MEKCWEARKSEDGLVWLSMMGKSHKTVEKAVASLDLIVPVNYKEEESFYMSGVVNKFKCLWFDHSKFAVGKSKP